ncbi:DUF1553 domain-containing protein [Schlesneria paludicola]|uniref:DUF1553 domain-containing protein n=1 Tax=Schlesneria paludicola TaxID=360056 RepID=UPI00029AD220|nr:DUF1553 domain-containing protein [Schlesneria paludicola]
MHRQSGKWMNEACITLPDSGDVMQAIADAKSMLPQIEDTRVMGQVACRFAVMVAIGVFWFCLSEPLAIAEDREADRVDFVRDIQPLLSSRCVACHGSTASKSGLRLDVKQAAITGGESGPIIVAGDSKSSAIIERISSRGSDRMPPEGPPFSSQQIELLARWIDQGATWPDGVDKVALTDPYDWWSLKGLVRPAVPHDKTKVPEQATAIDSFVLAKLAEKGLRPSPEADRRTLARRLYFDLIGLPPTPEEMQNFLADREQGAYERLVERLLASPHYGERWARHWLDVVHYGDTHGYDKDQPRNNAWPYRDYVIRSFNQDKPYHQFVEEQIAGDVIAPETEDGITATGFIAAGPWDFIGHAEVPETKVDGMIARMLDRDDMVSNTCNSFISLTVQCARCHNHKFDPVVQDDYYRLQAVFAALDRVDRQYDIDPAVRSSRANLLAKQSELKTHLGQLEARITELGGESLQALNKRIAAAGRPKAETSVQFGYHSQIESSNDRPKWVQIDLGKSRALESIQLAGCSDSFNNIGDGFGFPVRFKVELSDFDNFEQSTMVADLTGQDVMNPGTKPLIFSAGGKAGRFVRVTATKLAPRQNDFIFALSELSVVDGSGLNIASGCPVRSLDSIEAAPRWQRSNLVDGFYPGNAISPTESVTALERQREELLDSVVDANTLAAASDVKKSLDNVKGSLAALPAPNRVYAGTIHTGSGTFQGTGHTGGKPRPISVLARGDVTRPGKVVGPGTVALQRGGVTEFDNSPDQSEGTRRLRLAKWITAQDNPLTWRSIVNRVWQYHFGRGIVDSPNDFGRMGQLPSHPELLDWLAIEFRDGGQSLKQLHRLIVNSATYRQSSNVTDGAAEATIDAGNVYLWRMNRRKLEAEAIRDSALAVAGMLNRKMGGPAFKDFVVEKPEHSPHYEYQLHDPEDTQIHRRSVYRFLVRSQPQPFMSTLDCADPSMSVDKRNETLTALQALALLNNRLMLTMAKHLAMRVESEKSSQHEQLEWAFELSFARKPTVDEQSELTAYAQQHGLISACRLLLNLNEFVFVD